MQYLNDLLDAITALPANVVIGGVFLALMLALPMALAYAVGRRRNKDVSMMLVGLAMAMNLVGMALAIGHSQHAEENPNEAWARTPFDPGTLPQSGSPVRESRPPGRPRLSDVIAERVTPGLLSGGDIDHDGRLSTDEATAVVAAFINLSAYNKSYNASEEDLRRALAEVLEPHLRPLFQPSSSPRQGGGQPAKAAIPRG